MKCNLPSISQFCDIGYMIQFYAIKCLIKHVNLDTILLVGKRNENVYVIDFI